MLNFYSYPDAVRITYSLLSIICAGFTALVLVLHQYRFHRGLKYWLDGAVSFLALCQAFINIMLIAQVQHNITEGFIVPSDYVTARYIVFTALTILFIFLVKNEKALLSGVVVAASFLTLPVLESWMGGVFPFFYSVSLAVLLVNSILLSVRIRGVLNTSISGLSIKQAMDSLDTAVLFYKKNGYILMQNGKMQELMRKTAGRVLYNGRMYFETVVIPNAEDSGGNSYLYRITDGEWLYTTKNIGVGRKAVIQLTATDVTEQNRKNLLLQRKQKELNEFVDRIEEVCRSEELLRVKTEIHDTQNIKLTTLLHYLRNGTPPTGESYNAIKESILQSISQTAPTLTNPKTMLETIIRQYGHMGIMIQISGDLPPEQELSAVLVKILREAAANAVKHGYANVVTVDITYNEKTVVMRVTDNSVLPPKEIKEGGGIAGMRLYTETLGGNLTTGYSPRFTLTVHIPRKEGESNG